MVGDGYRYILPEYQQYYYQTNEVHSYPLEIWMEFGILGIISILSIIGSVIIKFIKKIKEKNVTSISYVLFTLFAFIFIHSFMDFDMSFMYIQVMFFVILALLNYKEEKFFYKHKKLEKIFRIIIVLLLIYNIQYNFRNYIDTDKQNVDSTIESLEKEPYVSRLSKISRLLDIENNNEEWIKYLIKETKKDNGIGKYDFNTRLTRARLLKKIERKLQKSEIAETKTEIQEFLNTEYGKIENIIKYEKDKIRFTDEEIEEYVKNWSMILN